MLVHEGPIGRLDGRRRSLRFAPAARAVVLSVLILTVVYLTVPAPAAALDEFIHADADRCADCHGGGGGSTIPNTVCTACHTGFQVAPGDTCWRCHEPGAETDLWRTSAACSSTCHLWDPRVDQYVVSFEHGLVPHDGADYGLCLDCHDLTVTATDPDGSEHHDAVDGPAPACGDCHSEALHDGLTDCAACHSGMDIPPVPATCTTCHAAASFGTGTCTDPACHGTAAIHSADPGLGKLCSDCHTPHYEDLGTCESCHPDVAGYHHLDVATTPLADCSGCHDGTIASDKGAHVAWATCATCHDGMDAPPTPAVCSSCHDARDFGTLPCSACHADGGVLGADHIHRLPENEPVTCTDCHAAHFADVGACDVCHAKAPGQHHGTVALSPSRLAVAPLDTPATFGEQVVVSGTLSSGETGLPGGRVVVQWREAGTAAFATVTSTITMADGSFTAGFKARASGDLRAVFAGLEGAAVNFGPAVAPGAIAVRPTVALAIVKPSGKLVTALDVKKGTKVAFRGVVKPRRAGVAGVRLVLERSKSTSTGTVWVVVTQVTRTLNDQGRFGWTWKAGTTGRYRLRAGVAASTAFVAGESPFVAIRVR
jgi:hypothetical protein